MLAPFGPLARHVALAGLLTCLANVTAAQRPAPQTIARTIDAIRIDGRPDEPAWRGATPFRLTMYTPSAGGPATDSSDVRLMHDDTYLYAAGWFFTPDPRTIKPGLFTRDQMAGEDHFMVILDSQNDNQTAYVFSVVPSGARTDMAVSQDGQRLDGTWNAFWDAASTRDDRGWYSEMRIPLSTLRFQTISGRATMGLIIHRFTPRHAEYDTYPSLDPSFGGALFRPSIAGKIVLESVQARSPLYVTPYTLVGRSSITTPGEGAAAYHREERVTTEAGLDAKFGVSSSLAVDLTVNTDFAQAEADNQQVNLTRFSLFFPERRQFFIERSDLFAVSAGRGDLLFHSRRIGLSNTFESLRIYGGARVVGRVGQWDVGAMSMQTDVAGAGGSENNTAVRARRELWNPGTFVGGLLTSRLGNGGPDNQLISVDAQVRFFGNEFLTVQGGRSFDQDSPSGQAEPWLGRIGWARRSFRGLQYGAEARWVGEDFNPGLGFQTRAGVTDGNGYVGYGWLPGARTAFSSVAANLSVSGQRRHRDDVVDVGSGGGSLTFNFKSGLHSFISRTRTFDRLDAPLRLPGAVVDHGEYRATTTSVGGITNSGARLSMSFSATFGGLYDGDYRALSLSPRWNVSEHLQLGVDANLSRIDFSDRDQRVESDIFRLRVQHAANSRISAAAFLQYNRATDVIAANVRFRWQFLEGRDLWIVFNDQLDTDRAALAAGQPRSPLSTARTFLIKYSHTLAQ